VASEWWVLFFCYFQSNMNIHTLATFLFWDSGVGCVSTCFHCILQSLWTAVYPDGKVCISILHPPGDDPNGYELATERWSPVHTVCDISFFWLLWALSLLSLVFFLVYPISHRWYFGLSIVCFLCLHLLWTLRSCPVKFYQPYVFFVLCDMLFCAPI
jgi:hypothetical protein